MTTGLLVLLGAALVLVVAALVAVVARSRASARETRHREALERLERRLDLSLGDVRAPSLPPFGAAPAGPEGAAPLVADRLPGRAALLEAVGAEIERARAGSTRLTIVLVRVAESSLVDSLVEAVREVTGRRAYAVGPTAAAFTLPGQGRANGLGAVARVGSRTTLVGHAAEWRPEETPAELVARLLAESRPDG